MVALVGMSMALLGAHRQGGGRCTCGGRKPTVMWGQEAYNHVGAGSLQSCGGRKPTVMWGQEAYSHVGAAGGTA